MLRLEVYFASVDTIINIKFEIQLYMVIEESFITSTLQLLMIMSYFSFLYWAVRSLGNMQQGFRAESSYKFCIQFTIPRDKNEKTTRSVVRRVSFLELGSKDYSWTKNAEIYS